MRVYSFGLDLANWDFSGEILRKSTDDAGMSTLAPSLASSRRNMCLTVSIYWQPTEGHRLRTDCGGPHARLLHATRSAWKSRTCCRRKPGSWPGNRRGPRRSGSDGLLHGPELAASTRRATEAGRLTFGLSGRL